MPGIVDLVRLISLNVTRGLVQQGLGLGFDGRRYTVTGAPSALAIVGATNATPIVLTCSRPHAIPLTRANGRPNEFHAVVSGVEGNTAANAVDANPRSRTIGMHRGVQLVPISATQFEMYAPSYTTGLLTPVAGNGTYTTGGTITPGLTAGQVLLGREHTRFETSPAGAPPFMCVVPVGNDFADGDRRVAHGAVGITAEARSEKENRSIAVDNVLVELHAWGAAYPPDAALDFDITQRLYQQFMQSLHLLGVGSFVANRGTFDDQQQKATQIVKLGHYHVTTYSISTPVLEFSMPFVETPITIDSTTIVQPPDGSPSEVGCGGGSP